MKNEHKKEGLFLDFLKQLHLWGYSIADKSILSITEMRTRPSSILFTLRHSLFSFRNASRSSTLSWKNILNGKPTKISVIWEVFLKVAGVHQNHWHLPNMYSMCPTQSGNQHFDNELGRKMKLPLAMQLQLDLSYGGIGNLLQFLSIDIWVFS